MVHPPISKLTFDTLLWAWGAETHQELKSVKVLGNTFDLNPKWAKTLPSGIFHRIFKEPPSPFLLSKLTFDTLLCAWDADIKEQKISYWARLLSGNQYKFSNVFYRLSWKLNEHHGYSSLNWVYFIKTILNECMFRYI